MDKDIWKALDQLGLQTDAELAKVRADMRAGFDRVRRTLDRQQHVMDEAVADSQQSFARHRQNVGTILFAYVEDVNVLKHAVRHLDEQQSAIIKRLDNPEDKQAS